MAQNKTKRLSARVDEDFGNEVEEYANSSPTIEGVAQLIRIALKDYMDNNPIKEAK